MIKELKLHVVIKEENGKMKIAKRQINRNINVQDEIMIFELMKDEAKNKINKKFERKIN